MREGAVQRVVNASAAQEGGEKVWRIYQQADGKRETTR
jgi:hypothetical protein